MSKKILYIWISTNAAAAVMMAVYYFVLFPSTFTRSETVVNFNTLEMTTKDSMQALIHRAKRKPSTFFGQMSTGSEESIHPPFSSIHLKKRKNIYKIGDVVEIDITGMDQRCRRKHQGGDMVRIWVKDLENGACASGRVIDNQDGSYRGVVKLLWAGNVTIVAGIGASRQLVELVKQNVKQGRSPRHIFGKFKKGEYSEIKNCTAMESISLLYKETCNVTEVNSNLPWYCEKPGKSLTCKDWVELAWEPLQMNYSLPEQKILGSIMSNLQMKKTIHIQVTTGGTNVENAHHFSDLYKSNTTCNKLPAKYTWSMQSPVGYLYKGRWFSTQCQSTFDGSVDAFNKCLYGRKLWLFGDSTSRQFFLYLNQLLKLKLQTEKWVSGPWHKPSLSSNTNNTIKVFWAPHALPFNSRRWFEPFAFEKGTHVYIDSIPPQSRDILVVHFYLHFMAFDPSIVRTHFRKTADSIKALKTRAPGVKVLIKGSHAFNNAVVNELYDFWGIIYDKIAKEEFASLADDVIFLNFWDMTVATENWDRHVNDTVLVPMVNQLMTFVCK